MLSRAAREALDKLLARDDPTRLVPARTGWAARGMTIEFPDVDVYVVRGDDIERETDHSATIDEIYRSIADLEQVDRYGTANWYFRCPSPTRKYPEI
jgi:hypothetical protein